MSDNMVWLFQFQAQNMPRTINLTHQVYTTDDKLMTAFLKQHQFNNCAEYVQYIDLDTRNDIDVDGIEELRVFKVGSNKLKRVVNLVTSEHFMEKAVMEVCSKMSQVSLFGDLITQDLAVLNDIKDQVQSLPFGQVLDVGTDEYDSLNVRCRDPINQLYSSLSDWAERCPPDDEFGKDPDAPDDAYIYDSLCEEFVVACSYNEPVPITLEAYTEYFVSLLTDEYT